MRTLLLIDAHSLIHRCYHALPPLTSPSGAPTNALYGVSMILQRIFATRRPDFAAAAFDRPEPTFRKVAYDGYKAHRPKAPDDLVSQLQEARTLFSRFGIAGFEKPGVEGDDIIATLVERFRRRSDVRIVILTGDLDALQLVSGSSVVVETLRTGIRETYVYDEEAIKARYGLLPSQLVDYKALVGDHSDNVPGVAGIGPKTAGAILKKYSTLEHFFETAPKDDPIARKIFPYRKEVELARFLVRARRDVEIEAKGLDDLVIRDDEESLSGYFTSLGFHSLLKKPMNHQKSPEPISGQTSIFSIPSARSSDHESFVAIVPDGDPVLLSDRRIKIGFSLKEAIKGALSRRIEPSEPWFDLGVAFWLLQPDLEGYSPELTFPFFLKRPWKGSYEDMQMAYAFCREEIDAQKIGFLCDSVEMPLIRILAEMEQSGIGVSRPRLSSLEKKITTHLTNLSDEIISHAGHPFNINSPQQLAGVLFDELHIPNPKKRGRSTAADVLEELKGAHPIIPAILRYREDFKLLTTYVAPLSSSQSDDGRIHTDFRQTGTGTGRISSQSPNMQNIPQSSRWSQELRASFTSLPRHSFLSLDYSQLELRILAGISGDERLLEIFSRGEDVHTMTASRICRVPPSEVDSRRRRIAKVVNFGLIYGMGVASVARAAEVSRAEAADFIEAYFSEFPKVRQYQEDIKALLRKQGYVETLFHRRRYFPQMTSSQSRFVAEAERAGVNHPIQGLESDFLKLAMVESRRALVSKGYWLNGASMILSIHDELLFEVRDDIIKEIVPLLRESMERVYPQFPVALRVEISCGKDWGHLEKY